MTAQGLQQLYVLVFLCLQTNEVIISSSTRQPDSAWVCEPTREFIRRTEQREKKPTIVTHDGDTKFPQAFVETLGSA